MSVRSLAWRAALRLHRAALQAYPSSWRGRFGVEHHALTLRRWRASRGAARVGLVLFTILDTVWSGGLARMEARRRPSRDPQQQRSSRMDGFWRHLRYGWRALAHARGFTAITSITLAVGIGSATTAFTAFDAALLEPLPYPHSERLAVLGETLQGRRISVSYPDFLDWRASARSFETMASFRGRSATLTGGPAPERLIAQIVSADLFRVLGTAPAIGRVFAREDDRRGAPRAVVLGHALWRRLYAADPAVLGQSMQIDGGAWEIIGVMPASFSFPGGLVYGQADLYMPIGAQWISELTDRDSHPGLAVIGLLSPGVTMAQARDEMTGIAAGLAEAHPDTNRDIGVAVDDAVSALVGDLRGRIETVTLAASLLLLIACANVGGLTLTRALARRRELLVRSALGETRGSLALSLLAEHLVLALLGAAGGVALAFALTRAIRPLVADLPRLEGLSPDLSALAFAVAAAMTVAVLLGLAPMAWLRRLSISSSAGQRGASAHGMKTRHALVSVQLALAVALVASAILFTTSFRKLAADPGGINADGTLTFQLQLPNATYSEAQRLLLYTALHERLSALPGVTAVGAISTLPFSGAGAQGGVRPAGADREAEQSVDVAVVSPGYFEAMGVTFIRGRNFGPSDVAGAPAVAVVDQRLADRFWPGEDPVGKRLDGWGAHARRVIGVVGHVKNYGAGAASREELFVPLAQRPSPRLSHIVRTVGDPAALAPLVRNVVADLDPGRPVYLVRTMRDLVDRTIAAPRLAATLSAGFGALALILAAVGVYGLVAYSVELRRREAGIRMALGATPAAIVTMMLRSMAWAVGAGVAAGIVTAIGAGRWLRSELFAVSATDPGLLGVACATLGIAALVAAWLPARRAARVPPAIVLQEE